MHFFVIFSFDSEGDAGTDRPHAKNRLPASLSTGSSLPTSRAIQKLPICCRHPVFFQFSNVWDLRGHVVELLGEGLLDEGELSDGPDLGVLFWHVWLAVATNESRRFCDS